MRNGKRETSKLPTCRQLLSRRQDGFEYPPGIIGRGTKLGSHRLDVSTLSDMTVTELTVRYYRAPLFVPDDLDNNPSIAALRFGSDRPSDSPSITRAPPSSRRSIVPKDSEVLRAFEIAAVRNAVG